jgi:PleD family two-component response regulator
MIVDTNRSRTGEVAGLLRRSGFHPVVCNAPLRAMGVIRRERPDAVVLEVIMPGRSGFEIAARMQADPRLSRIPLLFTSDIPNSGGGNHDYFPRPLNAQRLVETLKERILVEQP